jgi:CBS domain-containing protein
MISEVVSVAPTRSLDDAIRLFESCRFHHLPVAEKGRLVGMISDRDIALATGWILSSYRHAEESSGPQLVGEIMRTEVHTLTADATFPEAAALILDHRISAVPLLEGDELVGIITSTDLLRTCREGNPQRDWSIREGARVKDSMSRELTTVSPDDAMKDAIDLCNDAKVRHLLVIEEGRLAGVLSDRDIRFGLGQEIVSDLVAQAEGRMEVSRTPVSALMATEVVTIGLGEPLTVAADLMLENGFGALPVLDAGQLVGIITQTDILRSCC